MTIIPGQGHTKAQVVRRRPLRATRLAAAALVVACVVPAAAVAGAPPACAAGELRVAVVVDFGDLPSPPPTSVMCVAGSDRDTGADILAARARLLGKPMPRYNSSGLLCAIDGLPQTGCGERVDGRYRYWSYWHGTAGGWEYSSTGPAGQRARSTTTEGWRYVDGAGLPSAPPPRGPADPAATCTSAPPPSPAPTSSPSTAPPGGGAPGGSPAPAPGPAGPGSPGGAPASPTADPAATTITTGLSPPGADGTTTSTTAASTARQEAANRRPDRTDAGSAGRLLGTIAGIAAVAGLAGAGAVVARRRRP